MKRVLNVVILISVFGVGLWAYWSIDAATGIQFHETISTWPMSHKAGITSWEMDEIRYNDIDGDGVVDSRTTTVPDGVSDVFIIAIDNDKDGYFDELLTQRVDGDRAHSSRIHRRVPRTK